MQTGRGSHPRQNHVGADTVYEIAIGVLIVLAAGALIALGVMLGIGAAFSALLGVWFRALNDGPPPGDKPK